MGLTFAPFVPVFFQAKNAAPGTTPASPLTFSDFYDAADNSIGSPQAASGLTYSAGVFTCHAQATYAVTLQAMLAGSTAADTYIAFQPSGPDTAIAIKIESGAAVDASGRSQTMVYTVAAGDTFQVVLSGTASQTPLSSAYLFVTRLA